TDGRPRPGGLPGRYRWCARHGAGGRVQTGQRRHARFSGTGGRRRAAGPGGAGDRHRSGGAREREQAPAGPHVRTGPHDGTQRRGPRPPPHGVAAVPGAGPPQHGRPRGPAADPRRPERPRPCPVARCGVDLPRAGTPMSIPSPPGTPGHGERGPRPGEDDTESDLGLIVDSTVLLTEAEKQRIDTALDGRFAVVPLSIIVDDVEHADGHLAPAELCAAMTAGAQVSTSMPTQTAFREAYAELRARGAGHILVLTLSAALSGTCESAMSAAKDAAVAVTVVDSRT